MSAVFLETSALLRMLFQEDGGDIIVKRLRASERVICSRLIRVETERALIRLSLNYSKSHKLIAKLQHELRLFWPKVDFIEITREICDRAGRIAPGSRLRTLDAIHLATYYRVKELDPMIELLTFDERIRGEV
jgi:predicted nucleic acid-binding protein